MYDKSLMVFAIQPLVQLYVAVTLKLKCCHMNSYHGHFNVVVMLNYEHTYHLHITVRTLSSQGQTTIISQFYLSKMH